MFNEATERNQKILFHIEKELLDRYVSKNLENIIDKMDLTE
jgi:trimethylamine:corrinoid methyltransferase-like protein